MKMKSSFVAAALALGVCLQTGCAVLLVGAGAAVGAGAVAYASGELKTTEAVKFDKAWESSLVTMSQMQMAISNRTHDALSGRIVAFAADQKRVELTLKKITDATTEIRIRYGLVGDESASRQILEKIRKNF